MRRCDCFLIPPRMATRPPFSHARLEPGIDPFERVAQNNDYVCLRIARSGHLEAPIVIQHNRHTHADLMTGANKCVYRGAASLAHMHKHIFCIPKLVLWLVGIGSDKGSQLLFRWSGLRKVDVVTHWSQSSRVAKTIFAICAAVTMRRLNREETGAQHRAARAGRAVP